VLLEKQLVKEFIHRFKAKGLYLLLENDGIIEITNEAICKTAESSQYKSIEQIFEIKRNKKLGRCPFCPLYGNENICDSMKILAPFIDTIDKNHSFDNVICVYRGENDQLYHLGQTDFQNALKYCVILILTEYCEFGKKYKKYFHRIVPIADFTDMAIQLYMNIYCLNRGNRKEIKKIVKEMSLWVSETIKEQKERLGMVCKNDAFLNAFAGVQTAVELQTLDMRKLIQREFNELL